MSLYDDALPSIPYEIAVDAALSCENTAFSLAEEGLGFLERSHFDFNFADHDLSEHILSLEELFDAGINDERTLNHGDLTPLASAAPVDACTNKKSGLVTKECGHDAVCQCSKHRHRSSSHSPRRAKRCKPNPKPPRKIIKQGNRTHISQETRSFLESHFQEEQYPKQHEVESLAQRCGITSKAVKNWFSNARARRTPGVLSVSKEVAAGASPPLLPIESYPHSQVATMSDGDVQLSSEAQMVSPAPSNLSLERYLASPPEDEPVSNAAIEDSIKADYLPILNQGLLQSSVEPPYLDAVPTNDSMDAPMAAHLAMKQALMDSKMPSDDVPGFWYPAAPRNGSFASVASFDRGSRRGRRRWGGGSTSHSVSDYGSPATPHTTQGDEFDDMLKIPTTDIFPKLERTSSDFTGSSFYKWTQARATQPPSSPIESLSPCDLGLRDAPPYKSDEHQHNVGTERLERKDNRYFCTFPNCCASFSQKYQWTRHENSIHSPQTVWICCRTDSGFSEVMHFTVDGMHTCFVCGSQDPTYGHIIEQHFEKCIQRQESDRTFFRRDNLAQHIKHFHLKDTADDCAVPSTVLDLWQRTMPELPLDSPLLRCGFCDERLVSWKNRLAHVGMHFEKGLDMLSWNYGDTTSQVISPNRSNDDGKHRAYIELEELR